MPILKEETTSVYRLIPKVKSTKSEVVDEENDLYIDDTNERTVSTKSNTIIDNKSTSSEVKGLLRPDYRDIKIEDKNNTIKSDETAIETYKVDEEVIEFDINKINKFDISNYYPIIILCAIIALILVGVVISNIRNNNDDL